MQFCMELHSVNTIRAYWERAQTGIFLAWNLLYDNSNVDVKSAKQLVTSLGMKNITGSEKVCNIIQNFGHAISCSEEQGIIAEIGEALTKKHKATPDGLYREHGLVTSVAWDNYDKMTDSIAAGQQSMYDCMGVVYQNKKLGTYVVKTSNICCILNS